MERHNIMQRRKFLGMSSIAGVAAAAGIFKGDKLQAAQTNSGPRPKSEVYDRLEKHIDKIKAVNHHIHINNEGETIDWYHPQKTVGRTNWGSRGMIEGLAKLLDMSPEQIADKKNADMVREKHIKFAKGMSQKEYYTRLADISGCSHIFFLTFPTWKFSEEIHSDRFKCIPYIDHYMFPLDNSYIRNRQPACAIRVNGFEWRLEEDKRMFDMTSLPSSFQDYLDFVVKALEKHIAKPYHIGGKWSFAYYRSLFVDTIEKDVAKKIYEAGDSSPENYKKLQDYLAFHILKTMADREFSLQIHTGLGADPGLTLNDSNASHLDQLRSRPELEHAKIAILHGSYPYVNVPPVMAWRKNVWADFCWMVLLFSPHRLAKHLKEWIEIAGAGKLIFGVDGAGLAQLDGTWCARKAIAIALTNLVEEGMLSEGEAMDTARMMLRDNALNFYKSQL